MAKHVEIGQDKMNRSEAHGAEFKVASVYNMMMTGTAKQYFDIWEAERDVTNAGKSHEKWLTKLKDYARNSTARLRRKCSMEGMAWPLEQSEYVATKAEDGENTIKMG